MTSRDFVYWLQGFLEIADPTSLNQRHLDVVKNHLNMVFHHEIDPSFGDDEKVAELAALHNPKSAMPIVPAPARPDGRRQRRDLEPPEKDRLITC